MEWNGTAEHQKRISYWIMAIIYVIIGVVLARIEDFPGGVQKPIGVYCYDNVFLVIEWGSSRVRYWYVGQPFEGLKSTGEGLGRNEHRLLLAVIETSEISHFLFIIRNNS